MKKYEIVKNSIEIRWKDRKDIKEGCTLNQDYMDNEIIKSFDSKDEAIEALKSYKSSIQELSGGAGKYYLVTEYYVEENEYDEDGDFENGGDIWAFSKMTIKVIERETFNEIGTFDNMEDAINAENEYDGETSTWISFTE